MSTSTKSADLTSALRDADEAIRRTPTVARQLALPKNRRDTNDIVARNILRNDTQFVALNEAQRTLVKLDQKYVNRQALLEERLPYILG